MIVVWNYIFHKHSIEVILQENYFNFVAADLERQKKNPTI